MKLIRLALAAALAAFVSVHPVAADDNPVRQFLNEEASAAQPEGSEAPAAPANQVASAAPAEQKNDANPKNAWAGLVSAPAPAARTQAPADKADHAPILALIDKHASALGLPVAFARAIVRIESNFNPKATGRQREVGLMQIKYETARGIGFTGSREQLYDPDTNLQWGMKYLAMAWKLGGATPCGAVLRYQAGHMATQPTAASRAYCAKVNAHMASAN